MNFVFLSVSKKDFDKTYFSALLLIKGKCLAVGVKVFVNLNKILISDGPLDTLRESDDSSYVVLGPQRRSFQGGCHVAEKEKSEKPSSNFDRFSHAGMCFIFASWSPYRSYRRGAKSDS